MVTLIEIFMIVECLRMVLVVFQTFKLRRFNNDYELEISSDDSNEYASEDRIMHKLAQEQKVYKLQQKIKNFIVDLFFEGTIYTANSWMSEDAFSDWSTYMVNSWKWG